MQSLGILIVTLAIYVLSAARVVRFINADTLLDPLRLAIARRSHDPERSDVEKTRWSTVAYWLACPWCVSIWVCAATVWLPMFFADNRVVQYAGVVLAASMLIGVAAPLSSDEDIEIETT